MIKVKNDTNKFYSYSDFTSNLKFKLFYQHQFNQISQLLDIMFSHFLLIQDTAGNQQHFNITTNYQNFVVGIYGLKQKLHKLAQVQFRFSENENKPHL